MFSTDVFSTDLHDRQAQNLVRSLVLSGAVISCTKFKSSQEYEQIRSGRPSLSSHRIR